MKTTNITTISWIDCIREGSDFYLLIKGQNTKGNNEEVKIKIEKWNYGYVVDGVYRLFAKFKVYWGGVFADNEKHFNKEVSSEFVEREIEKLK